MDLTEKTLHTESLLRGIVFDVERQEVALGDGSRAKRDIIRHAGGVGVLCRTEQGKFLLVRQFRIAINALSLEIVAGMKDPGEDPQVTGKRELLEETGYRSAELHYLGRYLPSPGYTDEVDELFFAEVRGTPEAKNLDQGEQLVVESYTLEQMRDMIRENKIMDGKSIAAWFFAAEKGYI